MSDGQAYPWLVRLGPDAEARVVEIATADARSKNWVVRALVELALGMDTDRAHIVDRTLRRMEAVAEAKERLKAG